MKLREPVLLAGLCRTPIGKLGGILAGVEPHLILSAAMQFSATALIDSSAKLRNDEGKWERENVVPLHKKAIGGEITWDECRKQLAGGGEFNYLLHETKPDFIPFTRPEDVFVGNVRNSIGNIARVAALHAFRDDSIPAMTVDRQCASSMEALVLAAARINAGLADKIMVGGVESASQTPWLYAKTSRPYAYAEPVPYKIRMATELAGDPTMGETAETLADEFSITREEMDAFAFDSHRKATEAGPVRFMEYDHPSQFLFPGAAEALMKKQRDPNKSAAELLREAVVGDECVRGDTSPEALAKLRPVFRKNGRVTAGNSSPLNDGAVACYALSREAAESMQITDTSPAAYGYAWLTGVVTVGLDPKRMGLGPALAIPRLLAEQGLTVDDIDLFEINEAFAAQVLACLKKMDAEGCVIPREKLNVRGGAIALGHPLGATGLRLVVTLAHALAERALRRGVASLCVGGGQGMAVLIERAKG